MTQSRRMLVLRAVELQRQGLDINGVADTLLAERYAMDQVFTVGDIRYLGRTGRISNVKAFIGSVLDIRPILKGDDEGKIVCCAKVRGRKAALKALVDMYDEYALSGNPPSPQQTSQGYNDRLLRACDRQSRRPGYRCAVLYGQRQKHIVVYRFYVI